MGQQGPTQNSQEATTTPEKEPQADISRKRKYPSLATASVECPEKKKKADESLEKRVSRLAFLRRPHFGA